MTSESFTAWATNTRSDRWSMDGQSTEARTQLELDVDTYVDQYRRMSDDEVKRVTVNLPRHLLQDAMEVTGAGTTETIAQGLQLLARRRAYTKALALKGK